MRPPDTALTRRAEDAIKNEFGLYYTSDELPLLSSEAFQQHLPEHTADSAGRLGRGGPDLVPALVAVLERVAADPQDPLFEHLSTVTLLDWRDEDLWPIFQEIATRIAQSLQAGA